MRPAQIAPECMTRDALVSGRMVAERIAHEGRGGPVLYSQAPAHKNSRREG